MGFDLASVLKNVPESGTSDGRERIEYIGLDKLHDDPNNFYSLDGIEELAKLPADTQRVIVDRATQKNRDDIRYLYSSRVKEQGEDIQRFSKMVCPPTL